MELSDSPKIAVTPKFLLKWTVVALIVLVNLYADICMYNNGDIAYPLLDLVIVGVGLYVFLNKKMYAQRYAFPAVAGMTAFIIFPMIYTLWISFTNYSGSHVMTVQTAMNYHLQKTYKTEGNDYDFKLIVTPDEKTVVFLKQGDKAFVSDPVNLKDPALVKMAEEGGTSEVALKAVAVSEEKALGTPAVMKQLIASRGTLKALLFRIPDSEIQLSMVSLKQMGSVTPKYAQVKVGEKLKNGQTVEVDCSLLDLQEGRLFVPNMEDGFYYYTDENGSFVGEAAAPGFKVSVGFKNYIKFLTNESIRMPFLQIFVWTVFFSAFTVFITLAIGMVLACLVQWQQLRFRGVYRVFLILPYAVPSFISILVFKGLFNQNFGELNVFLQYTMGPLYALFGAEWTPIEWFTSPWAARAMILIVNAWLGYPYMMILCMGLLKSIPDDLYEATAIEGASPYVNLRFITLPLLLKPLTPLLIASFAFNFNNFVLIQLLTGGGPDIIEATEAPAGYTDLLVSFTYRIAFEGGKGNDYALAAAVAALIFVMVGFISLLQLRFTKASQMQS